MIQPSEVSRLRAVVVCLAASVLVAACGKDDKNPGGLPVAAPGYIDGAGTFAAAFAAGGAGASCAAGQLACGGPCVDVTSNALNCGQCGRSCGPGACVSGQCVCPSTLALCASGCVDGNNDVANCGACGNICAAGQICQLGQCMAPTPQCNPACGAGQTCVAGVCQCPAGLTFCGDACVDLLTTPRHCGSCEVMCGADQLCQAGKCACPGGQTLCGTQCVDLQTSAMNCGACTTQCNVGEACAAGKCGAGVGDDGCNGGSARDLSVQTVAAYQSLKIPLTMGMSVIDPTMRVASVVQGRPTLFRVFVSVAAGFVPRELSARVVIKNGATQDLYFARQMLSKSSTDQDSANTFQVYVPAEKIADATSYSVELVECTNVTTGTVMQPRVPAMGDSALSARKTGILKVTVIPVLSNSLTPDTSDAALTNYRTFLEAMYPIEKAELAVGKQISTNYPIDWETLLEQIRSQRAADKPPADVYYFGLLKPADSFKTYCRSGCTAGIGYVASATQAGTRAAVGLAYGDELSAATMAHEVGHNHGRNHAPCAPGGQISGVDSRYPYQGALIGTWGFDPRKKTFLSPDKTTDIMGYCDPKWISDYTYKGLTDRVATINGNKLEIADPSSIAQYRVLIAGGSGPRWSQPFPEPAEPFGDAESADVLDIDGHPLTQVTVFRTQMGDRDSATILVPPPQPGWHAIRIANTPALPFTAPISVPAPE